MDYMAIMLLLKNKCKKYHQMWDKMGSQDYIYYEKERQGNNYAKKTENRYPKDD
jgi:hypothetical protein